MYGGRDPKVMAAQLETSHKIMRKEWDRIKQDSSLRFDLASAPNRCGITFCGKPVEEGKIKVCSACKMAVYCSPQCAKLGWWSHKINCAALKRDGENILRFKTILKQFPWTDIGYDSHGDFQDQIVLLSFSLLGTSRAKVGYWAMNVRGDAQLASAEAFDAPWRLLSEDEGWRLPKAQIPSLKLHDSDAARPSFPPTFKETWNGYYQWRGLPMTSPAAILLQWPMTVYACLKELGFEPCFPVSEPRRKLKVFYVGARDEITFIPLFGELALNFPNTDLDLVMFGPSVRVAVERAIARGDTRSLRPCVFEYTAPSACGGGTVRVFLDFDPAQEYYRPSRDPTEHPDAIIALNAGLGSYISWHHVILLSSEFGIPFAVTDYAQGSLAQVRMDAMEQALTLTLPRPKTTEQIGYQATLKKVVQEVQIVDVEATCTALRRDRPVKFNQFMQPNCKISAGCFAPSANNAYIQVITPGRRGKKADT
ncbi:Zinc finger MYND domain-containing protein 15 [Mycena venus]|uniref:Zinc finger MYND domain-containing protein 15 n=1 Tax=Mycena venus TaxID=2733690 RepID=A0A8H6YHZ6_9AGAR|nr:Zinc finger MYND domain-containing protein 15 [Mycena venus]